MSGLSDFLDELFDRFSPYPSSQPNATSPTSQALRENGVPASRDNTCCWVNNLDDTPQPVSSTQPQQASTPTTGASTSQMSISQVGLQFIYDHEAQDGVSNRLYWPGGGSGVTLGPGYDFKSRNSSDIISELQKIGIPLDTATKVAAGAGLTASSTPTAQSFASVNRSLVNLTNGQQILLLKDILPASESLVRSSVRAPLTQYQYDALVSLAYNIGAANFKGTDGAGQNPVLMYVNQSQFANAAGSFWIWRKSGGVIMQALVERRAEEAVMFNNGQPVTNIAYDGIAPPP